MLTTRPSFHIARPVTATFKRTISRRAKLKKKSSSPYQNKLSNTQQIYGLNDWTQAQSNSILDSDKISAATIKLKTYKNVFMNTQLHNQLLPKPTSGKMNVGKACYSNILIQKKNTDKISASSFRNKNPELMCQRLNLSFSPKKSLIETVTFSRPSSKNKKIKKLIT